MDLKCDSDVQQLETETGSAETFLSALLPDNPAGGPLSPEESESAGALAREVDVQETVESASRSPLEQTLDEHYVWLETHGQAGKQADFSRSVISGSELTDANLREAILNKAVLCGADLLLADFQGASLMQADLRGANLLGTKFHDANLQGASLENAAGLQIENLSGANLFGAALPSDSSISAALRGLNTLSTVCTWITGAVALLCAVAILRIFTTGDPQLLANAPVAPSLGLRNSLRFVPFFLCAPVALLGIYIALHLCLQRLWDSAAQQPAIFPEGARLDSRLPWFARSASRNGMRWLHEHTPSLAALEAAISFLLLYALVPATLIVFWARYLTIQDIRGTLLHVIVVGASVFAGLYFARASGRAYRMAPRIMTPAEIWIRRCLAPGLAFLLLLFSFGVTEGAPHATAKNESAGGISSWASDLLWWVGYVPTAELAEAEISTRPAAGTAQRDDLAGVEGARLNGAHLRYMQAYGAFFAKARLLQADLSHANLAQADLREANLRQSVLESADLDHARLNHAVLQQSNLRNANLSQSDLQDTNLSRISAANAQFIDAKIDGANLYGADLSGALLKRASLQRADVRDAHLENADLSMSVLHQTYLSSAKMAGAHLENAQLGGAFLTEADLTKANLRGASLQGTMLNGANLSGANLQGADFRGALGLTAAQICSAATTREIQLDDMLQREATSLCGLNH